MGWGMHAEHGTARCPSQGHGGGGRCGCMPGPMPSTRLRRRPALQADLDLGNYERFLDISLGRDNNLTTGKIYQVRRLAALARRALAHAWGPGRGAPGCRLVLHSACGTDSPRRA